jgi:pimeloyl-ACP methyl ester carboxylesterase
MHVLPSGRFRTPVDGGHIAYRIVGQGAPVATAHPYTTPKAGHGPVPGFTTITIWPRGFGDSAEARNNRDYGFWRLSEDLDAVRQHLGLHTWSFWGTSMGGFVGLICALQFPETLSAIILDSTAPSHHYKNDPKSVYPTIRDSDTFRKLLAEPSWETLRGYFVLRSRMEGYADPEGMWEQGLIDRDLNPYAYSEIMWRLEAFDTRAQLGDIRIPTLILAGEQDLQCPPSQARLIAEGIPGSILKVFPDCGHGVIRTNPSGALDAVQGFMATALSRRSAHS